MSSDNQQQRITPFNGKDFGLWKRQVLIILKQKSLSSTLVKTETKGAEWDKKNTDAEAILFASLDKSVALKVASCQDAADIWSRLIETYESKNAANVGKLLEEYYSYRKSPGDDMATHISKVESLASHLETVGQC